MSARKPELARALDEHEGHAAIIIADTDPGNEDVPVIPLSPVAIKERFMARLHERKIKSMRYLFGPVPSRRLGYSLGVDIIPHKVCTLDCVYCQLGPTTLKTIERRAYVEPGPVLAELDEILSQKLQIDCITFSGSGEPTLNTCLGDIIAGIKSRCSIPVTVLTNGTLLHLPEVRAGLLQADIVCPSFDAATPQAFSRINRPHESLIALNMMIAGSESIPAGVFRENLS